MASSLNSAPRKFTFDLDLGQRREATRTVPESVVADMLADARTQAYAEGFADGERGATAASAQRLTNAAENIGRRVIEMLDAVDEAHNANLRNSVELAASIGRKLAANLMARHPAAEIEALVSECLSSMENVPHLVIRCHPELAEGVRETATAQMATSHFAGRLVVMGDPDQQMGDCRIEWVDGGLVRSSEAISEEINNRIAAYLAARGA